MSGKLINNALVMYDRETRSLWSQFLSRAVEGEFAGTELEIIAVSLTTWGQWSGVHPETRALRKSGSSFDPYSSYYVDGSAGVLGESNADDRLPTKALVFGLNVDFVQKAYPLADIDGMGVINDSVGGRPVLLHRGSRTGYGVAFARAVGGQVLTFAVGEQGFLVDEETGSRWDPVTGASVTGEMEGEVLEQLTGMFTFWFAWTDFYPETQLYQGSDAE